MPESYIFSQFKNKTDLLVQWRQEPIDVTFGPNTVTTQNCVLQFSIPENMGPPVLFYYQLTNFFQNHRRYVSSFDANQLVAESGYGTTVASDCDPLKADSDGKPYYPCGLIANSVFNDTFSNLTSVGNDDGNYNMAETGIAWDSDKTLYKKTTLSPSEIAVPPNWAVRYPNGYTDDDPPPDISLDEHFMVWMRTAALPTFSKLYMRNDANTLTKGTYQLNVTNCKCVQKLEHTYSQLTNYSRVSRRSLQGHKVHRYQHPHRDGWSQPVPGHCIRRRWRNMYPSWRLIHGYALAEATASLQSRTNRKPYHIT